MILPCFDMTMSLPLLRAGRVRLCSEAQECHSTGTPPCPKLLQATWSTHVPNLVFSWLVFPPLATHPSYITASVGLLGLFAQDPVCHAQDLPGLALLTPALLCLVQLWQWQVWLPPGAGAAEVGAGCAVWPSSPNLAGRFSPSPFTNMSLPAG